MSFPLLDADVTYAEREHGGRFTAVAKHTLTGAEASGEGVTPTAAREAALDNLIGFLEQIGGC